MDLKLLKCFLFLSVAVSYVEALYKPGNFLIIIISVILPAAVLLGFCGIALFICKNRKRIPILKSKFGTHEKLPKSAGPAATAPPLMPAPQMPPPQTAEKSDLPADEPPPGQESKQPLQQ